MLKRRFLLEYNLGSAFTNLKLKGETKMNYTKVQKEEIEKVKEIFADYIKKSKYLELLWSDKLGYVLLTGINNNMDDFTMHPEVIKSGEFLCSHLLYELACDTIEATGNFHDIFECTSDEKALIKKAYDPYMNQLPEYNHLIEKLYNNPFADKSE